jgi:hypothetical protein
MISFTLLCIDKKDNKVAFCYLLFEKKRITKITFSTLELDLNVSSFGLN